MKGFVKLDHYGDYKMVEAASRTKEAAWKVKHLDDYDRRLERAAGRVDELSRDRDLAALVVYEAVLARNGQPVQEVRELVRRFRETFEDEDEPLNIPRVSGIMNVHGEEWFFGDGKLRQMAGRLLGQFQHRVAQYNYVDEREVLRRWADSYDTRLFIRRRIPDTEPVAGVVPGVDLQLIQHLRVAAGGNTAIPSRRLAPLLEALGFAPAADDYDLIGQVEDLALHLELPAPVVAEMLEEMAGEGLTDFPEYPRPEPEEDEPGTGEEDEAPEDEKHP